MITSEQVKIWEKNIDRKAAKVRADRVIKAIKKYNPSTKNVLELGVGLGAVLIYLSKKYKVSGLDLHKEYVQIAKKRIPSAEIYAQSMHNFKINNNFDVIFSVHECINEVKPYNHWESTFENAFKHLNNKGLFIFDMRTEKHLEDMKKQLVKLEKTPTGYIYDNTIVKGNQLIWDTTYFKKLSNGNYKIEKDSYSEEIYPISKVKQTLSKHFTILETIFVNNKTRVMFICRKN